jgi:MFS family permease
LFVSIANATLQLSSAADMRTRVMAMYAVAFIGTTPIGAPIIGAIGQSINPRVALAVSGLAALLGGLIALRRIAFEREDSVALASENVPAQRS